MRYPAFLTAYSIETPCLLSRIGFKKAIRLDKIQNSGMAIRKKETLPPTMNTALPYNGKGGRLYVYLFRAKRAIIAHGINANPKIVPKINLFMNNSPNL